MAELDCPPCLENGNGIKQPDSLSLRAVSRSAGDLERYKERVWQLYAHHSVKQVCEILKNEDRIIVSGKMLLGALQQWGAIKNIKSEHKKYMIGLRRKRELEGKRTVIRYSLLSPGRVAKQLDRFIAEKDVHEHEQIEWESLAGPLPKEISYLTPQEPENSSSGKEENLVATTEGHLQDQIKLEITEVSATEEQMSIGAARSPWACISVESEMNEQQLNTKSPGDLELRALQLHKKHFGNAKYNWRKIDQAAEELWESQEFDEAEKFDRLAIELAQHHWGSTNKDTLVLKGNLASTLWARGRYKEALQLEAAVVESLEVSEGLDSEDTLWYKNNLSGTLRAEGKFEEAKSLSLDVVERASEMLGDDNDSTLLFKVNLARAYNGLRQWSEAKKILVTVTKFRKKVSGLSDKRTLQAYVVLGSTLQSLELWDEAESINNEVSSEIVRSDYPDNLLWTLEFMDNLAKQCFGLGQYFEAECIFQEQEIKRQRLLSARHPHTLASTIGIAHCLHCQTKSRDAMKKGQQVLAVRKEVLGDDHPSTLTAMVNLAWYECETLTLDEFVSKMTEVHRLRQARLGDDNADTVQSSLFIAWGEFQRGKFQEAQKIFDSTHAQLTKIHGSENHPNFIEWVNWKAEACEMNGQDHEAERFRRKGHKLMTENFGKRHPSTLVNARYLINSILRLGRHNEAEEMASNIISIIRDIHGSQHPRTMEFVQIIASINMRQGKWAKAEGLYAEVLKTYESYGEKHPYVISAKANLAKTQSWQGWFSEAEKLLQSVLNNATHVFGREHGDFASLLTIAADVKLAQDNWKDAIVLCQEAATWRTKFTKSSPFEFIDISFQTARAQAELGYFEQSEECFQRALDRSKRDLGTKHFMTLRAMSEMAWLQAKQNRWREAIQTQCAVLDANTQALGEHHPETMAARQRLAWMIAGDGDYSKSESLYKDDLEKRKSLFGPNHTLTLDVLSDLAWLYRKRGDLATAVRLYRELLDARCALLGYWNKASMITRMQLCELLTSLGFFAECKAIYDDLLRQTELKFGESSRQTALVLGDIAFLYRNADVLAEGEKYLTKALAILEDLGELSATRVFLMLDLAACYRREDRYLMAMSQVEKAKRLGEGFLGPKHPAMLSVTKALALSRLDMNDFDGVEETVRELLQQNDDVNVVSISNTLELKLMLGRILLAQGRVEESEILFMETIKPVMNGNIPAGLAKALLGFIEEFAGIRQKQRHFREAEALLERALSIRMQNPMTTDLEVSNTLRSLCSIKKDLGKYSEAKNLQSRVVGITISIWGEDSEQHLLALRGLAACLNHPNTLPERYSLQTRAAKKYIELYENEFPRWVPVLREIAVTLKRLRQYEEAEHIQRAILWWRHKNHEEVSEQYLWDVEFLAETYFDADKYERVKSVYKIASRGYRYLFGEFHEGTIRCIKVLGALAFRCGKMNESEEIFEHVLPIIRGKVHMADPQYIQVLDGLALAKLNLRKLKEAKDLTSECLHIKMNHVGERTPSLEELFLRLVLIDNMELKEMVSHWEHEKAGENFIDLLLCKLGDSKSAERLWFEGVVSVWSGFIFANDPAKSFKDWLGNSDIDTIIDSLSDSRSVERAWFSTWFLDDLEFVFNGVFGRRIEEPRPLELAQRTRDEECGLEDTVRSNANAEESESKPAPTADTSELLRLLQPILGQQPKDVDIIAMLEKLVPE